MSADTTSYKYISATGLVYTGATQLYSITLTAGSDTATLTLRDWTDTTGGAIIDVIKAVANTSQTITFDKPVLVKSGIYATLAGTSPVASLKLDGNFTTTSTSTSTTTSTSTSTSTS